MGYSQLTDIIEYNLPTPALYLWDEHKTHMDTVDIINICIAFKITLISTIKENSWGG